MEQRPFHKLMVTRSPNHMSVLVGDDAATRSSSACVAVSLVDEQRGARGGDRAEVLHRPRAKSGGEQIQLVAGNGTP